MFQEKTRLIKNRYGQLVILTLFYLLVRLTILFVAIDKVHLDEELYRGNIAKELIEGPVFPFFDYQRSEYEGGSLVNGVLAVPFFLLFGETLLSLKLVGLAIGVGLFILCYLFLDTFFGRRVAVWTSLLYILSPPFFTKLSISSFGGQDQISFFTMLAIFIFYQIFFIRARKTLFAFLGGVCGFGLFFSYSFLPTLLTIVFFWFIFDKKFFLKKDFLIFATAFVAGFSPWIFYNLTHNFQGFIVCDRPVSYWFLRNNPLVFLVKIKNVVTADLAGAFAFKDITLNFKPKALLNHPIFSYSYYGAFVLSFCALSFFNRRSLVKVARGLHPGRSSRMLPEDISHDTFLLLFPVIFVIVIALAGIQYNTGYYEAFVYRYRGIIPLYPLIPALVVLFLCRKDRAHKGFFISYLGSGVMILLLGLGLLSNFNFVFGSDGSKASFVRVFKGYNYYNLGRVIAWRFDGSPRWLESIKGIKDTQERRYCYAGMGWGFAEDRFDNDYAFYLEHVIDKIEKRYWPYVYDWMGEAIERELTYDLMVGGKIKPYIDEPYRRYFYRGVGREAVFKIGDAPQDAFVDFQERIDPQFRPYFYEGLGIALFDRLGENPRKFYRFMDAIDQRFKPDIYEGLAQGKEYYRFIYEDLGFGIRGIGYNMKKWKRRMKKIESQYRPACYQRLGIEVGWRFIHDIKKYLTFLAMAPEQYRPRLYKGLGIGIGWRFGHSIGGCTELIEYTDQEFWPYLYEGLGIGIARSYAYDRDSITQKVGKISPSYKVYFSKGVEESIKEAGI
jgi:hypothetical protein